jgi:hypothetical protein
VAKNSAHDRRFGPAFPGIFARFGEEFIAILLSFGGLWRFIRNSWCGWGLGSLANHRLGGGRKQGKLLTQTTQMYTSGESLKIIAALQTNSCRILGSVSLAPTSPVATRSRPSPWRDRSQRKFF